MSQVWFKEHNRIEFNFNLGCGVFVNQKSTSVNPFEILKAFDEGNNDYKIWRSIFVKVKGFSEFEFENKKLEITEGLVFGKIKDFDFVIEDLNILKANGDKASNIEKDIYN